MPFKAFPEVTWIPSVPPSGRNPASPPKLASSESALNMKYFVINQPSDDMFYVAYRYDFCHVAVPVMQFSNEVAAMRECERMNKNEKKEPE